MKGHVQWIGNRPRIGVYWDRKTHWITHYVDGKPLDAEILERALQRIRSEIDGGTFRIENWTRSSLYIFKNAVEDWKTSNPVSHDRELNRNSIIARYIMSYFAEKNIKEIDSVLIRDWWKGIDPLPLSPCYKNEIKKTMKFIMSFHSDVVRTPRFPKIKMKPRKITFPSPEDQDRTMEFIKGAHHPIFTLILESGCRPSEACKLKKVDIDREARKIIFRNTKNGRDRDFPIIPSLEDALRLRDLRTPYVFVLHDRPYTHKRLWKIWNKANVEANKKYGIKIYRLYDNRSACASRLASKMDPVMSSDMMGHDLETARKYYIQYDIETKRRAVLGTKQDKGEGR